MRWSKSKYRVTSLLPDTKNVKDKWRNNIKVGDDVIGCFLQLNRYSVYKYVVWTCSNLNAGQLFNNIQFNVYKAST